MPGFGYVSLIPGRSTEEVAAIAPETSDLEQLIFDGLELYEPTFTLQELDLEPPAKIWEWAKSADRAGARLVRPPRMDLWEITARLRVNQQGTMDGALDVLGTFIDKVQLAEQRANTATPLTMWYSPADSEREFEIRVLAAEIDSLPRTVNGDDAGWLYYNPTFTVRFFCEPGALGAQENSGITVSGDSPYLSFEIGSVRGDLPAEAQLIAFESSGFSRNFVEWGMEQRHYNPSAPVFVANADMETVGVAGSNTASTGAYPTGNAIRASLQQTTPIVVTTPQAAMEHVGKHRIKLRVKPSTADVQVRLAWRAGDAPFTFNPYVNPPGGEDYWSEVDLGVVDIQPVIAGDQTWTPRYEAIAGTTGATIDVDYMVVIPVDNGYGKAKAGSTFETPTEVLSADNFTVHTPSDPLDGKDVPTGGTWDAVGDTTDWVCQANTQIARPSTSDTEPRIAYDDGSMSMAATAVQVDQLFEPVFASSPNCLGGPVCRFVDASNWFGAFRWQVGSAALLMVSKRVAGVTSVLGTLNMPFIHTIWTSIRVQVDDLGRWSVWMWPRDFSGIGGLKTSPGETRMQGFDAALEPGGALDVGGVGIHDYSQSAVITVRYYDNFFAFEPNPVAAMYGGSSLQVRDQDPVCIRQSGTSFGRPPTYRGQRFELPPAGAEGLTSHVVMKAHRNDIDQAPAEFVDDSISGVVVYRPRYSSIPRV